MPKRAPMDFLDFESEFMCVRDENYLSALLIYAISKSKRCDQMEEGLRKEQKVDTPCACVRYHWLTLFTQYRSWNIINRSSGGIVEEIRYISEEIFFSLPSNTSSSFFFFFF